MSTLYYVCPGCQVSRMHHQICCASWPLAVDLDDSSLPSLVALLSIDVMHRILYRSEPPDP